eukprot:UN04126
MRLGGNARRRMRINICPSGVAFPWEAPQMPHWHLWSSPSRTAGGYLGPIEEGERKLNKGWTKMPELLAEFRESRRGFRKGIDWKRRERHQRRMERHPNIP